MALREFVSGGPAQPQQFLENGGSAGGVLLVLLPGFKGIHGGRRLGRTNTTTIQEKIREVRGPAGQSSRAG